MPSGRRLQQHLNDAIGHLEAIEAAVMAFRVARELDQLGPQARATLLTRVQTRAEQAAASVQALRDELGAADE